MRDVISAGAGITGFAIESARDLVQYMVKRGQMTPVKTVTRIPMPAPTSAPTSATR